MLLSGQNDGRVLLRDVVNDAVVQEMQLPPQSCQVTLHMCPLCLFEMSLDN